jgi:hypothetical protein
MFTNHQFRPFRLFGLSLAVVVMGVAAFTIRESAATSAVAQQSHEAPRTQESQEAETTRWVAMATFYEELTSYGAAEASAYRWQAMANFQLNQKGTVSGSQLPKPLTEYDTDEALAYRWQAMANHYKQHGSAGIR